MKVRIAIGVGALALAAGASAQVIDTYGDWDGNITNGWNAVGQSFVAQNVALLNYKFNLQGGGANVTFDIFNWNAGSGPVGAAIYSQTISFTGAGDYTMSNINVAMTPGNLYGAVVDLDGYTGPSVEFQVNQNSYNQGNASWNNGTWQLLNSTYNTRFRAEFGTVPEPATIAVLGLGVVPFLRRRKRA